jgi:hypothetical protein
LTTFNLPISELWSEAAQCLARGFSEPANQQKKIFNNKRHDFLATKIPDYQAAFANFEEYVFFKGQNVLKIITKEIRASGTAWADQGSGIKVHQKS